MREKLLEKYLDELRAKIMHWAVLIESKGSTVNCRDFGTDVSKVNEYMRKEVNNITKILQ